MHPGWAVKAERMLATKMTTTTEAALEFLPAKKTVVTGYPVRASFFTTDRAAARSALGVAPGDHLVVIAGASQGAARINSAAFTGLETLLGSAVVYHVTGAAGLPEAETLKSALPAELTGRYNPAAFRADLPELMVAADVGVFRAGASVLGEVPAAALPSVLVPGRSRAGTSATTRAGSRRTGPRRRWRKRPRDLTLTLTGLLGDPERLAGMRESAKKLARPDAADAIAAVVLEVARK